MDRRVLIGAVAVTAVGVLGCASADPPSTYRDGAIELAVLITRPVEVSAGRYASEVLYLDPETGDRRSQPVPDNNYGEYPVALLQVDDQLLLPGGGQVLGGPTDLRGPLRDIAPALVFVPSARRDRVWTISHWQPGNTGPYQLTEIDAHGTPVTGPVTAPAEAGRPIVGTDRGLLLQTSRGALVWDPESGEIRHRIERFEALAGNGWGADRRFAWVDRCSPNSFCADLRVLDLATGAEQIIEPAGDTVGFLPDGAVAPDRRRLAVFARRDDGDTRLLLVNLANGGTQEVPGSAGGGSGVSWAPDGGTVYFGQDNSTAVAAHRVGATSSRRVGRGLPQFTAMLAIGEPSL